MTTTNTTNTSKTSTPSGTPIAKQVEILNDLFQNRFPDSDGYGNYFWERAIVGAVQAHLVSEGQITIESAKIDLANAFSVLLEHWFSHQATDIGFSSLEEIESDDTLDKLEQMGVVPPQ